jgi:hypothetical protein
MAMREYLVIATYARSVPVGHTIKQIYINFYWETEKLSKRNIEICRECLRKKIHVTHLEIINIIPLNKEC